MGLSNSYVLYEQYVKQKTPKGKTVRSLSWKEFVLKVAKHWVPEVSQPEDHLFVIKATYSCVTCSTMTNPVHLQEMPSRS